MRSPLHWGGHMHPGDHAPPQGGLWAPFWAFCYVITDLRIYPPPSPSPTLRPGDAYLRIKLPPEDGGGLGELCATGEFGATGLLITASRLKA
jgi:hypothetical protein